MCMAEEKMVGIELVIGFCFQFQGGFKMADFKLQKLVAILLLYSKNLSLKINHESICTSHLHFLLVLPLDSKGKDFAMETIRTVCSKS